MDAKLHFGKICIIEWLRVGDLKTGWELFDELQPMGLMSAPPVAVEFARVRNRPEFVGTVRQIAKDFQSSGKLPLLHIETHGSDEGIGSTGGDGLSWAELMDELIPLNEMTGLRLWVVLAACEGLWGLKMAQPVTRAAFLALLGPNQPISAGRLQTAILQFYRTLFRERNGNAALDAMNQAVVPGLATFGIVNAEMLFKNVYTSFLREQCSEPELARRADGIVRAAALRFKAERGVEMQTESLEQIRSLARRHVEAIDEHFTACRRHFFFVDVFPENDQRFPVTLESCRAAG